MIRTYYYPRPLRKNWVTLISEAFVCFFKFKHSCARYFERQTSPTCFLLFQILPIGHCCNKESFIGTYRKWDFLAIFLEISPYVSPLSCVSFFFFYMYVLLKLLPLLPKPLQALVAAGEAVIPLCVSEAGPVATFAAHPYAVSCKCRLWFQWQQVSASGLWASCYRICFCYTLDNSWDTSIWSYKE